MRMLRPRLRLEPRDVFLFVISFVERESYGWDSVPAGLYVPVEEAVQAAFIRDAFGSFEC